MFACTTPNTVSPPAGCASVAVRNAHYTTLNSNRSWLVCATLRYRNKVKNPCEERTLLPSVSVCFVKWSRTKGTQFVTDLTTVRLIEIISYTCRAPVRNVLCVCQSTKHSNCAHITERRNKTKCFYQCPVAWSRFDTHNVFVYWCRYNIWFILRRCQRLRLNNELEVTERKQSWRALNAIRVLFWSVWVIPWTHSTHVFGTASRRLQKKYGSSDCRRLTPSLFVTGGMTAERHRCANLKSC